MRYLFALPLAFAAGFLWTLGQDAANRIIIRRNRAAREARKLEVTRALDQEYRTARRLAWTGEPEDVYYIGNAGPARWTAQ